MQTLLQATFQPNIQNVGLMMKIFVSNCCRFRTEQNSLWIRNKCRAWHNCWGGGGGGGADISLTKRSSMIFNNSYWLTVLADQLVTQLTAFSHSYSLQRKDNWLFDGLRKSLDMNTPFQNSRRREGESQRDVECKADVELIENCCFIYHTIAGLIYKECINQNSFGLQNCLNFNSLHKVWYDIKKWNNSVDI